MAKFIILLFASVLHHAVVLYSCIVYPPPDYNYDTGTQENNFHACPEGQSLFSTDDIKEIIDYIAKRMQLEENIINSTQLEITSHKYLTELQVFHEKLQDRPKHIKHILEDMESKRLQMQSVVDFLANNTQNVDFYNKTFRALEQRSNKLLTRFEMYKKVCKMNCEDQDVDGRPENGENITPVFKCASYTSCWKIKDLYNKITEQLTQFQEEAINKFANITKIKDKNTNDRVTSYKNELYGAAIKKFGTIMYDILSLQDDYYHFAQSLKFANNSTYYGKLNESMTNIEQILPKLEDDLNKYGLHCMNCHTKENAKSDITLLRAQGTYATNDYSDTTFDSNVVDDLIDIKTQEINQVIENNINKTFETLEEYFNAFKSPEEYINNVLPIDDVAASVKKEKEAFEKLKRAVPNSSIDSIKDLLRQSEELLKSLEHVGENLNSVFKQ